MARKKPKVNLANTPKPHVGDLASLFSTDGDVEQASGLQLLAIRIDAIVADPTQPRKWFDDERLQELSESIRQDGVIQPIEVTEIAPGSYMIVHGERRWRASQLAGRETIPAVVRRRNYDQTTRFVRQMVENIQREDLNDVDRAQGLIRLRELMREEMQAARDEGVSKKKSWKQVTWSDVGNRLGYSRQRINQLTNLLDLPNEVQDGVRQGSISERETRVLRKLTPSQQRALFREYEAGEISNSEYRELASFLKERPTMMVQEAIQIMDEPEPPPQAPTRPEPIERSVLPTQETAVSPPAHASPTPPTPPVASGLARRNNADQFRYIHKNLASLDQAALAASSEESLRQLRLIRDAVSSMIIALENS